MSADMASTANAESSNAPMGEGTSAPVPAEGAVSLDAGGHDGVSEHSQASELNRPLSEFRAQHSEEFLEPMSRSHPIDKFSSPEQLVERINPDYGDRSGAYDQNCADCARSFERSWRGDFEEAAGRAPEVEPAGGLVAHGEDSARTEEWAGERFADVYDSNALQSSLQQGGHGSSAIVHTVFTGPDGAEGGHAYNVVNDHGTIRVCDAQVHTVMPWTEGSIHQELGPSTRHWAMAWGPDRTRIW